MGSGGALCHDRAVVRDIHVGKCCRPGHTRQTHACPWESQSPELGYAKVTLCTSVGCLPFPLGKSGRWVPGTGLYYFYNFCNYFNIVKTDNNFSGSLSLSWLKPESVWWLQGPMSLGAKFHLWYFVLLSSSCHVLLQTYWCPCSSVNMPGPLPP